MKWINFIAGKFARGTEGHIFSDDLVRVASRLENEAYHCVFDLVHSELKHEKDTGQLTPSKIENGVEKGLKKIYSYHAQNSPGFETLPLSFNQYEGPARPAFGLVQFDFDHAEDPAKSHKDALGFIEWLGVPQYHLAYSGSKGFHVAVPFELFGLDISPELPKLLHDLAAHLVDFFPTMDVKVYNANRKFRILNTRHAKTGRYKTLINKDMTLDEVIEYSSTRRDSWYLELQVETPASSLVKAIEESRRQHEYNKAKAGSQTDQTRFEAYDGKICIQRLISDTCGEGGRNNTALIIAYDFFKTGKNKDYAVDVLSKWANSNGLPLQEAMAIVDRAYSGQAYYNHGCQDSLKASKCSAKCPLWKKLDPDKRPVPVDAPKIHYIESNKKTKIPAGHFIEAFIIQNIIKVDLANNWMINGEQTNQAYLEDLIYCEALSRKRTVDACSKQTINAHLNIWLESEKKMLIQDLRNHIKFGGESNKELKRWLQAVRPGSDDTDLAVMMHWIWQVKRKIFSLPVKNHLMPVFCGLTNTGKSVAIRKLISPLQIVSATSDLKRLADSREDFILIRSFIMFLDEMAKANLADVETIKTKITEDFIEYRKLGTNASVKGPQNCTFIGSSNYGVVDIIKDPTSARRFYELWINERCDWATINQIDYMAIWRGVDENYEPGYYEAASSEIRKRQEVIRDRDSVEEWLEDADLLPRKDGTDLKVQAWTLYDVYAQFMQRQKRDRFMVSINKFGRLMAAHCEKIRITKGVLYTISSDFQAHGSAQNFNYQKPIVSDNAPEINF